MRRCASDLEPAGMSLTFPVVWFGGALCVNRKCFMRSLLQFHSRRSLDTTKRSNYCECIKAWAAMPNALALSVYDWRFYVCNLVFSCTSELVPRAVVFCCIIRCVAQIYSNFKTWQANLSGTKGLNFTAGLTCCDIIWYQWHVYIYICIHDMSSTCSFQKQLPLSQQTFVAFVSQ